MQLITKDTTLLEFSSATNHRWLIEDPKSKMIRSMILMSHWMGNKYYIVTTQGNNKFVRVPTAYGDTGTAGSKAMLLNRLQTGEFEIR